MRSIYWKVLLWFLLTLAVTGTGLLLVSAILGPDRGPMQMARRDLHVQLFVARRAYETSGAEGLREHFDDFDARTGIAGRLLDASGRDLLTGEDASDVLAVLRRPGLLPPGGPRRFAGRPVVGVPSDDGKYWYVTYPVGRPGRPRHLWRGPLFIPSHLWVFAAAGLFSLWLAYSLTRPVRQLQLAVEAFGKGDLSRRLRWKRSDEIGDLATAFDGMAERIESLVGAERRLLADMSHELRSPLTRLGLAVELARSGGDTNAALDRIEREAGRLNDLVGSLLQVTRGEADPNAIHKEPVDLGELLAAVVSDCQVDAAEKPCRLEFAPPPAPLIADADPELLRRAVENPLRNAIRHSPRDQTVTIAVSRSGPAAEITIRDRGPGVAPKALPQLFDAFYRAENTGGFGLGLSIARRAVELHGGAIRADNVDPGLRVTIRIPIT